MHRFQVELGYSKAAGYCVRDTQVRSKVVIVFRSNSKSECITKAQELNGFTPVDGDEQTYGRQIIMVARMAKQRMSIAEVRKQKCEQCNAGVGEHCFTRDKRRRTSPHRPRWDAAWTARGVKELCAASEK